MSDFRNRMSLLNAQFSRRRFLQTTALAGAAAAAVPLIGTGSAMAQTPQRGGNFRMGLSGGATTDSLDPALASGTVAFVACHCWGDTLVESDPKTGEPLPSLATSWSPSPDAKVWTFKIRDGVRFHDGSAMTVDDVVATLKRHTDENSKSGALGLLGGVTAIENTGGDLVVTLREGDADLPLTMTDYHLQIQPKGGVDNPTAAIGTGPYKLASHQAGVRTTFERNADDWRDDRGFVDSVELIVMNDSTARMAALSSGQVQFINTVDPKTVNLLGRAPNVEVIQTSGKGFYSFLMHCDTAPFDNNDLRLALKYAIDREAILQRAIGGFGTLGNDYPVNENYLLAPEGIEQRAYDPDKAAFHYKQAGHEGPILLRTSDAAFPGAVDAAVLFQQSARAAGITLDVRREPADGYWTNVWNVQPFSASYWGGRPTQDLRYTTSYLSSAEWNDTRFKREDFDALLVKARGELDEAKRRTMYRDMAIMVRDEGGLILPVFNDYLNAASKTMRGWVDDIGNDLSNGRLASRIWLEA
ncbi:ABC transporter substrate-binding protein [Aureimonas frigidaquae]|uniref:ABC transporter substrate-binding protein n=1 Tax=Aureimonas frigidaquae TaxID=424757 RepID=UPI0007846C6C|nr:ABC transporter substrate-binding protein [Aureimonas frigidaquae]